MSFWNQVTDSGTMISFLGGTSHSWHFNAYRRFNPEDHAHGGPPKRGGQFQSPTRSRASRQSLNIEPRPEEKLTPDLNAASLEKKSASSDIMRIEVRDGSYPRHPHHLFGLACALSWIKLERLSLSRLRYNGYWHHVDGYLSIWCRDLM